LVESAVYSPFSAAKNDREHLEKSGGTNDGIISTGGGESVASVDSEF
jgi:hypothetical protein